MLYTTNYDLKKPELTDVPDITELNENWDEIDNQLKINNAGMVNHIQNSSVHFSAAERTKLAGIQTGAIRVDEDVWEPYRYGYDDPYGAQCAYTLFPESVLIQLNAHFTAASPVNGYDLTISGVPLPPADDVMFTGQIRTFFNGHYEDLPDFCFFKLDIWGDITAYSYDSVPFTWDGAAEYIIIAQAYYRFNY